MNPFYRPSHHQHLNRPPPPPPHRLPLPSTSSSIINYPNPNFQFPILPPPPLDTTPNRLNNALQIRNLSPHIPYDHRDQVLYGLGATSVHNHPYFTVAYFHSESACLRVIQQLHQRVWHSPNNNQISDLPPFIPKRLKVEFLKPNQSEARILPAHAPCDASLRRTIQSSQKEVFESAISDNEINHHNCAKNYNFPPASASVIRRITSHLLNDSTFYKHVLLLMAKLGLRPPFDEDNPDEYPRAYEDQTDFGLSLADIPLPPPSKPLLSESNNNKRKRKRDELLASDESEMEDDIEEELPKKVIKKTKKLKPRKRRPKKKLKTGLLGVVVIDENQNQNSITKPKKAKTDKTDNKTTTPSSINEIFEQPSTSNLRSKKTLEIKVSKHENIFTSKDTDTAKEPESSSSEGTSHDFGLIQPNVESAKIDKPKQQPTFDPLLLTEEELISDREIAANLLDRSEWINVTAFRGYQVGEPSLRLHVKNLNDRKPFSLVQRELYRLYGRFVQLYNEEHLNSFNIVYMNKGRMHGQAFISLPSVEIAERALRATNGYQMFGRPIVVSFSRSQKGSSTST